MNESGVDCVSLANYHIRDFGDVGLEDTVKYCKEVGLDIVGGGMNDEEAKDFHSYKWTFGGESRLMKYIRAEYTNEDYKKHKKCVQIWNSPIRLLRLRTFRRGAKFRPKALSINMP